MTAWVLLLMAIATQPAPELKDVVAAWTERASATDSADVELTLLRDSRNQSFGTSAIEEPKPTVRLRYDRERRQLDVSRLTVVRRDGRTRASESNPDRARVEFRNVLLEEELKGPQIVPFVEPATLIIDDRGGTETGQELSPLDRLLADAAFRAAQPLRVIDPAKLELTGTEKHSGRLRLIEKQSADHELQVWTEPAAPYRPVRFIQHARSRPVWQVDLTWGDSGLRFPSNYFVQMLNGSGESLEFVEALLSHTTTPLPASSDFGQVRPNRDQPVAPSPSSVQMRTSVRNALDSNWLPVAVFAVCALLILARARRKPAIS
jgi:hypothetical protein